MEDQNSKTRKAMKKACKDVGGAEVARAIGMHPGTLSNMISGQSPYEPLGKTPNLIDACLNFMAATQNDETLAYLAMQRGFIIVRNPGVDQGDDPAIAAVSKMLTGFAQLIEEISNANGDLRITGNEAANIRHRWEPLKRCIEEFVVAAEAGTYCRKGEA
ncbi:MAG: hypothetical protein RL095_2150 [Verrucomicrobiota bacterium]|jgi:hypothetical protein